MSQKEETENTSKLEDEIDNWKTADEVTPVFSTKCEFQFFPISCFTSKIPPLDKIKKKKTGKPQFPDAHYNVFHYCIKVVKKSQSLSMV